jgi:hypothetical protein
LEQILCKFRPSNAAKRRKSIVFGRNDRRTGTCPRHFRIFSIVAKAEA